MRIGAVKANSYKPAVSFVGKNLLERAENKPNPEKYYYTQSEKIHKRISLKNKYMVPFRLFFNKYYNELKNAQEFKEVDFKKILTDLKTDRDFSLAIGDNIIESEEMGGAIVDRIGGLSPYVVPLGEIEEYDYSKTNLKDYAKILNNYVKDESIPKEEKLKELKALSTVGELVFKIERR